MQDWRGPSQGGVGRLLVQPSELPEPDAAGGSSGLDRSHRQSATRIGSVVGLKAGRLASNAAISSA